MTFRTIEECNIVLHDFETRLQKYQEKRISEAMKPYKNFFGLTKKRTREQASTYCQEHDNLYINANAIIGGFKKYYQAKKQKNYLTFYQNSFYDEKGNLFAPTQNLFVLCAKWHKEKYQKAHFYLQSVFDEFYTNLRRSKEHTQVPEIIAQILK